MTASKDFPLRLVSISGNLQRPSRSRGLAELIARRIAAQVPATIEQYDILDARPGLGGDGRTAGTTRRDRRWRDRPAARQC